MKKNYVSPAIMHISTESSQMICASGDRTYSVNSGTTIGASTEQSPYGNDDYQNEGYSSTDVGGFPTISTGEADDDMVSRSKSGSIWDD